VLMLAPYCPNRSSARRQKAGFRRERQPNGGRRLQGKKVCTVSFLTFFNWSLISAALH
jgi:hypothetical protein